MWSYRNPVHLQFGVDAFERTAEFINGRPYVLLTYAHPLFAGLAQRLAQQAGAPLLVIDDVRENPDIDFLRDAAARLYPASCAAEQPPVLVALGGGSVIDSAKCLAAFEGDFARTLDYLEGREQSFSALPIIAVPTTAGTGSEVTCWATVWDPANQRKLSLAHERLYPEVALCDPQLGRSLPRGLTVATGLDALSHALESIWNTQRNPLSLHYAETAAKTIIEVLPRLADDLDNLHLRSRMLQAATWAGLAFSNTRTALAHNISYAITLEQGTAHGIACSFSLPRVLRWAVGHGADIDESLARVFGVDASQVAEAGVTQLEALLDRLGVSRELADYGLDDSGWAALVQRSAQGARGRNFAGQPLLGDSHHI